VQEPAQKSDNPGWRITRAVLNFLLSRSASRVLLTAPIRLNDGSESRWLKPQVRAFTREIPEVATELRKSAQLVELPTIGSRLMVEFAVLTIVPYRILLSKEVDPASARRLVADIGWNIYGLSLRLASLPHRLTTRDPGKRMRRTIRSLLRFPFNGNGAPGYEVVARQDGQDIRTNFTHCPPQSFVRSLIAEQGDKGDLEAFRQSWCQYDWPGADEIAADGARGHYSRTKTLSYGDKICDMCWKARAQD
jgi:hypothetical protein